MPGARAGAGARLRLALQYLIATMMEAQPAGGKVMLLLGEGPAGAVLRVEGERAFRGPNVREPCSRMDRAQHRTRSSLRRVRLAIASRVLETAGASLVFGDGGPTGRSYWIRSSHSAPGWRSCVTFQPLPSP